MVDLRCEPCIPLAVVAGRADVREDVAGAVVEGDHGAVVQVGAAETTDPARVAAQPERPELLVILGRGQVGQDGAALDDPAFTVADYRAEVAVGPQDTRTDLHALLDAGLVRRVAGSRGLRYRRT